MTTQDIDRNAPNYGELAGLDMKLIYRLRTMASAMKAVELPARDYQPMGNGKLRSIA